MIRLRMARSCEIFTCSSDESNAQNDQLVLHTPFSYQDMMFPILEKKEEKKKRTS